MCELLRADIFEEFRKYRINSNCWNNSYQANLNAFDRYCVQHFPQNPKLIQEMLNSWYEKKPTESRLGMKSRTQVVTTLLRYTQKRYNTSLYIPDLPKNCNVQHVPHFFSVQELSSLFSECDRQVMAAAPGEPALRALTFSVMFRTLYSTGMRTLEIRLLKPDEIDFDEGMISITDTKAGRQHYVALDPDVSKMLLRYHEKASTYHPNRSYFFFNRTDDKPFSGSDLRYHFDRIWKKVNSIHVIPYDLRHNYAVQNINRWIDSGIEFHDKFLYLSKSMGHTNLESTRYYYHLVPNMANIIYTCDNDNFDDIVPEVYLDEKE